MKKCLKIFLFTLFLFTIFTLGNNVKANSIQKIAMDIYVDNKGDATVTEVWNCKTSQGTEVYHPYYNLGNSQIQNLTVSEGNKTYQTLSSWNTSGTLNSKAHKCGINHISNGVELCWGISSYGSHVYTVKYTITNFVANLSDSQMIYWTLIPYDFSNEIGNVYIKIHSDFKMPQSIDVWGYGNTGTAYVYDGYIEMNSDGRLPQKDYMTILVKFPTGTFKTTNSINKDFNYYYQMAEEGAIHQNNQNSKSSSSGNLINTFFSFLPFAFFALISTFALASKTNYDLGLSGKSIQKNADYFRDIPCQNNLYRAYYIAYKYGILKKQTDILGSIILKWLKDDLIKIESKESGTIFKKENTLIILNQTNPSEITNQDEARLFSMLYEASKDGILENKEFEQWCSKSYSKILSWFDDIIAKEEKNLISDGSIIIEKQKKFKIFTKKIYKFMPTLRQEALELAGLKRYLLDYSLIQERKAIEVHLFEEYLIYAQMLGIAKEVAKQFKEIYPEIIEQSHYTSYDYVSFVYLCTASGISRANSAKARAESYSSGGGGFSSSGGGGGSFGGGGGGGGFR